MRNYVPFLAGVVGLIAAQSAAAQAPMLVAPSGRATTEVSLTLADTAAARAAGKPSAIRIDYGQPHLRGRALHTETLVPYDKVWRLGANGATMLTTDVDLVIGGSPVPRGSYVLQAIPGRDGWKLLVQKAPSATAAAAMNAQPQADVARVDLRVTSMPAPVESLTMWLIPSGNGAPKGELRLAWGTTMLTTDWSVR